LNSAKVPEETIFTFQCPGKYAESTILWVLYGNCFERIKRKPEGVFGFEGTYQCRYKRIFRLFPPLITFTTEDVLAEYLQGILVLLQLFQARSIRALGIRQ
jgi:hypothetical protein